MSVDADHDVGRLDDGRGRLADLETSASTASLVMAAVTTVSGPISIFTCAVVAPLVIATTVPLRTLRAESFMDGIPGLTVRDAGRVSPFPLIRPASCRPWNFRRKVPVAGAGIVTQQPSPLGRNGLSGFRQRSRYGRANLNPNRFAAIVYDNGAKVDGLMSGFAQKLIEAGVDAHGIVQLPPDADGCGPGALMKLCDVATGEVMPLCQDLGPGAEAAAWIPRRSPAPPTACAPQRADNPKSCSFRSSANRRRLGAACAPSSHTRSAKAAPC